MMKTVWAELPAELWYIIVKYAGATSWPNLSLVNRCFYNLVLQQKKVSRRIVTLRCTKKLPQSLWKRLRARSILNLDLEKCNNVNLNLVLGKLSNITSLKLHIDNLTESSLKCLANSKCVTFLTSLDLSFTNASETSMESSSILAPRLRSLSLKGSFLGTCQGFLQPLLELNKLVTLSLKLQWLRAGLDWDKARVVSRKVSELIHNLPQLTNLEYRFEAHSNYESLFTACDQAALKKLKTLHLEKAVFNSAPTRLCYMSDLTSLTLVDCLSMISHHSHFFEGMSSLKELTLRHVEDSPNILSHLPSTLTKISLRSMTSTKAFSMYLKKHGGNIEHLELDGMFQMNCMLVESFPNILPNLKVFHYRHNYYEFGTVMSFLRFKHLLELDMSGCTSHSNIDITQLRQIVKDSTDNRLVFTI